MLGLIFRMQSKAVTVAIFEKGSVAALLHQIATVNPTRSALGQRLLMAFRSGATEPPPARWNDRRLSVD